MPERPEGFPGVRVAARRRARPAGPPPRPSPLERPGALGHTRRRVSMPTSIDRPPAARRVPRAPLVIVGMAVTFMVLFAGQALVRARLYHLDENPRLLAIQACTRWLLYAALAPVVGALVARWPIER